MMNSPNVPAYRDDLLDEPRFQLSNYLYVILKHRWLVLSVMLTTWLIASIGSFLQTPRYRSAALIQIDRSKINLVQDVTTNDGGSSAELYATQQKILRSRALAQRVAEELALWEHPAFARALEGRGVSDPKGLVKGAATELLTMMQISHLRRTQLMEVSFLTPDPDLSARLANALVEQYTQFNVEEESGLARSTSSFIKQQMEELREVIVEKEALLRDYSRQKKIVMAESRDENIVIQRLQDLNGQLTRAEADRAAAEADYRSLLNTDSSSIPAIRTSAAVRDLHQKFTARQERHAALASRFKPDWPEVKRLSLAMTEAKKNLEAEVRAERERVVASARLAYRSAVERERLLRTTLNQQKVEAQELNRVTADYDHVKMELDSQRQMLRSLLRRQSETDLSADLGEQQPVKIRVVDTAEVSEDPFSPNVPMNLFAGALLGVFLGASLAFAIDYFDNSVSTVEELRRYVPLPYLGMVPRYDPRELHKSPGSLGLMNLVRPSRRVALLAATSSEAIDDKRSYLSTLCESDLSLAQQRSILAERFRFLRGSLLLSTPGSAPKPLLITSPDQNCGKTFVSCNLGAALVQLGKTVLLVDGDLRKPHLHKVFQYRNRVGLSNVLTGQRSLGDGCVVRTHTENLFLLMAGARSPRPGELLASPAMSETLELCGRHFDFVVIDSAPLLPIFDTHTLTALCDAVALVTRNGQTTRAAIKRSIDLVQRVNGNITGVVLNDVDLTDYAQFYYHSTSTYEYSRY